MERVSTHPDEGLLAYMWGSTGGAPAFARFEGGAVLSASSQLSVFDDVKRLEQRLEEIMIQIRALAASRHEDDVPEVFELHATEVRHVMAQVRTVEPARFYFVAEDDDEDLET